MTIMRLLSPVVELNRAVAHGAATARRRILIDALLERGQLDA
jgi:predicted RNA polymerase sigma factor